MTEAARVPPTPPRESWWLIERRQRSGQLLMWWRGPRTGKPWLTGDVNEAIRFRNRGDADSVLAVLPENDQVFFHVTEHMWLSEGASPTLGEALESLATEWEASTNGDDMGDRGVIGGNQVALQCARELREALGRAAVGPPKEENQP